MGQYHQVYNLDKKEFVNPHNINCGLKLWEQIGFEKSTADVVFLLLANSNGRGGGDVPAHPLIGRWAGDRIVVQGDYAEVTDPGFIDGEKLESYEDISELVRNMIKTVWKDESEPVSETKVSETPENWGVWA